MKRAALLGVLTMFFLVGCPSTASKPAAGTENAAEAGGGATGGGAAERRAERRPQGSSRR